MTVAHDGGHILDLVPFGLPFGQAAIQNGAIRLAEQVEQPPHPLGRQQASTVIDDNLMPVANAHRPHSRDEFFRRRRHMRQVGTRIGDFVDVKETGPRNMGRIIFCTGITPHCGQIP